MPEPDSARRGALIRAVRPSLAALLPPVVAFFVQWFFWSTLSPFAWFLFYPTVFISTWIGGYWSGIGATLLSTAIAWWAFIPPQWSLVIKDPLYVGSTLLHLTMGIAFSAVHGRLRRAKLDAAEALAATRRTNESLKQAMSERQVFAALIENSSDFIGIADAGGKPVYVNPAGRRLIGLPDDYPVEDSRIPDYYPPEERAFASDVILKSMNEQGHWKGETFFRHWQTEEAIPVSDTHFLIREAGSDRLLGMGTVTRDISDIKRMREEAETAHRELQRARDAANENEERFHALVDASAQIVWTTNAKGAVVEDSPSWRAFTGQGNEQWKGSGWLDAVHPEYRERAALLWREAVRNKTPLSTEYRIRHVSGEWRWTSVRAVPLQRPDGSVKEWVGMNTDITAAKQAEQEQRFLSQVGAVLASTIDFEETLAGVASLVVRELADCCIVDLVEDDLQVRRLKVVHRDPAKTPVADALQRIRLDRYRPHFASSVLDTRQPLLMTEVTDDYLTSIAHGDEHLRALRELAPKSLMAMPLVAHGKLLGDLVLVSTTQDHRFAPPNLRLAQELAHRAALAVENARLYRSAQRAIVARDDVLGIVAHDLRNPLNAIQLAAGILRRQLPAEGTRTERSSVETILRSSQRVNRLIRDLLDVTRIDAGQLSLERHRVPAAQIVADAVEAQGLLASSSSIELRLDAPPALPEIWADSDRLLQVFENLIGNAVKFTGAGGRVTAGAAPRDREVLFWVADTGPGIAAANLPHLFDRFWQARKTERTGAGLGLPICKGIVENHGGRIWAESTPGRGSTFFFTVPTAPSPGQEKASYIPA